ncbi:ATP-binding protein [Cystobacter fuscus]|uniref:ATP-binding protein n=1 Tax=Cystobacter fuscus TaxID=43 RepID=UPI002B2D21F7|nr:HAMP domain-containing protein [Cystobacter fuscus]
MGEAVSRAGLNRVRVEWVAAAFGLLTGVTMVYVPYEFGTSIFRLIYPYIRLMGTSFMVGSAAMLVALLYPTWPAWIGGVGRALFMGTLTLYWWKATVLGGVVTGVIVYPVMGAFLLVESLPRWRTQGLFTGFLLTTALAFGAFILVDPSWLGPGFYPVYRPVARPMGVLFLVGGALLGVGWWRSHTRLERGAVGMLTLLFGQLAFVAGYRGTWTGMQLYFVMTLGGALMLFLRRPPETSSVGWRLFRGVALVSVLPILAVGALASVFAQRAIERELRDKARQAVETEIARLEQTVTMARFLLLSQARDPVLLAMLRARDAEALRSRLRLLEFQPGPFDAAWVLDGAGRPLPAPSLPSDDTGNNFAFRDYFQGGQTPGEVYLSRPFRGVNQMPMVAFSTPVVLGEGQLDVLVGGMALPRMGREQASASRDYRVEIFDRRGGELLRATNQGGVLSRAPVISILDGAALTGTEGITEAVDASGRRLLIAHAQVPGTPWSVSVTAPLRQAFAAVTRLSAIVVLIALAAGAVALLLSRWVGRDVAQRLTALRDGFAALGTLRLDQPVPTRGDDELAQLTEGFNEMAARIERTQKELREAIDSRDQFMSMASHELRTPLTPLKATIELLLRQCRSGQELSPERLHGTLERLRRQVDRLTRLIGDMLDVSRLRSGRFSLRRAPMDLGALSREVVDRIAHARGELTAPISLELPDTPLVGVWDEQRLDQVLTNLVENAVRYSRPDKPIHVRVRLLDGGVLLEVEDQGIGVPAENLPHLFEPFYRAQNASAHHAGGLGLGLAICREIVERHGGRIHAESQGPGQGTRFSVFIPGQDVTAQVAGT